MIERIRNISFVAGALCVLPIIAEPVDSMVASDGCEVVEEEAPQNLWVWPTVEQTVRKYQNPSSVWTPEIGMWYHFIADDGYKDMNTGSMILDWGDDFVVSRFGAGYTAGTFLPLEPGRYVITCFVDGTAAFRFGFYEEVDGGYKWLEFYRCSKQNEAGRYERVFTVPETAALTCVLPCNSGGETPLTVTDIEIYRLDE